MYDYAMIAPGCTKFLQDDQNQPSWLGQVMSKWGNQDYLQLLGGDKIMYLHFNKAL